MGLLDFFRPQWKHSDWSMRKAAVERITDHTVLAEIAKNDDYSDVSKAAIARLTDQAALAGIARTDWSVVVRWTAVKRLTDPAVLHEIARSDNGHVRAAAKVRLQEL